MYYYTATYSVVNDLYFFFFLVEALQQIDRRLFHNGSPVINMAALLNEEYRYAGELMASSIVQGGPAPCFLSKDTFSYILNGVESVGTDNSSIDTVEDVQFKETITKVL